jgi:tRNA G10  N-methylase Trm11
MRYSRSGELVLDPMVGSGTTLVACAMLNRRGLGVDLSPEAERAKKKRFAIVEKRNPTLRSGLRQQKFILGDARDLRFLDDSSIELLISHPPYLNMMDYGPAWAVLHAVF